MNFHDPSCASGSSFLFFVADDIDPQLPCPALQQLPLAIIIHTPLIPACSEFTDSHRAVTATNGKLKAPTVASVLLYTFWPFRKCAATVAWRSISLVSLIFESLNYASS